MQRTSNTPQFPFGPGKRAASPRLTLNNTPAACMAEAELAAAAGAPIPLELAPERVGQCTATLKAAALMLAGHARYPVACELVTAARALVEAAHCADAKARAHTGQLAERARLKACREAAQPGVLAVLDGPVDDQLLPPRTPSEATAKAILPQNCYVCKVRFRDLHHFYAFLCPACADVNYKRRHQTGDLRGMVAVVTGARVKIGFFVALKLLRAGAEVVASTRFPADARRRFALEADFGEWAPRLHVFSADFRVAGDVQGLADFVERRFSRLDVLINNACQTIRRPAEFYRDLIATEAGAPLADAGAAGSMVARSGEGGNTPRAWLRACESELVAVGSACSFVTTPWDEVCDPALMPRGAIDASGQQVDCRPVNSWVLRVHEVPPAEAAEVMVVNALAPFMLLSRLLPLMERTADAAAGDDAGARGCYVVNVSSMEGAFTRRKSDAHPHTNMAKAALNMLTRTCAHSAAQRGVFITSVDTGWVNLEDPLPAAVHLTRCHDASTPLDEIDGAARVLDPVFAGAADPAARTSGVFLKDYAPRPW
jgi:NAD(P)-dependent dehydrogenase (short-subunit alcohol dehydrogenase family)